MGFEPLTKKYLSMCTPLLFDLAADSFEPGQGHEPAAEWVGAPHDGMGPECLAERARNAPPSGSNHKRIVVRHCWNVRTPSLGVTKLVL